MNDTIAEITAAWVEAEMTRLRTELAQCRTKHTALAQLVTPETAVLLEYLAEGIDCLAPAEHGVPTPKTDEARKLAAQIREALDDSQA